MPLHYGAVPNDLFCPLCAPAVFLAGARGNLGGGDSDAVSCRSKICFGAHLYLHRIYTCGGNA